MRQAKRYILTQTGFELDGEDNIVACRQFEDFYMHQSRFGDWGGAEGHARGRACSGDAETIECASWCSQFGASTPELQRCALRVMHMWSCASPVERNWAVHEGIHTKKCNRLAFEKVVQLVEITANVRLTEYRRVGCRYVLPWQREEGMLGCQAGLEVELVRTGNRKGMTEQKIAQQVALIARDPIETSAPPSGDAVCERRACIFRPYPGDDDSDDERAPEAADDPTLPIPHEIDETHDDANDAETRTYTARRAADRAEREMMGGGEDCWGPFGEVAFMRHVHDNRVWGSHHGLLQRFAVVCRLRLRSRSPRVLQEDGGHRATLADKGGVSPSGGGGSSSGNNEGGGSSSSSGGGGASNNGSGGGGSSSGGGGSGSGSGAGCCYGA
ncbi:hypothetical protein CBR_g37008 [Chara braunii]|uniref:HAT C-terminal dimerisation domain-containing protein n=1 Tax=Chara braunii TaxID=69332 RepID=A0A388LLT5_CHABU|nr:hypothetical protein CBR_g37008 [Chara braunii]|eukprot:GBG83296.1 hypothetical protein CBR_g37008 [Chara braunii]